jgi:hypothetical protein
MPALKRSICPAKARAVAKTCSSVSALHGPAIRMGRLSVENTRWKFMVQSL